MFNSMRLKNFKAYKDSGDVPLAPLTVIVGANNSGKSTLFHALLGLVQTARDTDQGWAPRFVANGPFVNLNGYHDILHGKGKTNSATFEFAITLDDHTARPRELTNGHKKLGRFFPIPKLAKVSFGLDEHANEIRLTRSALIHKDNNAISVAWDPEHLWSIIQQPADQPTHGDLDFFTIFPWIGVQTQFPMSQKDMEANAIGSFSASLWTDVFKRKINHIGPLRSRIPWYVSVGANVGADSALTGDNLITEMGSKEKDVHSKKTRLGLVNEWFAKTEILKRVHHDLDKNINVQMLLGDEPKGPANINIAAMGEGVSQVLPIIANSLFGMNDDCLLVEQPEIHLHPALQAELGDLFIEVAQTGHRQILVETHSEHLLLRIRRRIAEGSLKPDQVSILFVEKEKGESKVHPLDLNNRGHFSNWPKGFFDEAYQEAMALAEAASRKG